MTARQGKQRARNKATVANSQPNNQQNSPLPTRVARSAARALPLSGSEDVFSDAVYGSARGKGNNNCYAWAMDEYRNSGDDKLQPGNMSAAPRTMSLRSCADMRARALADARRRGGGYAVDPDTACKRGYYKIMGFLDPGTDHHWYKQHRHALVSLDGAAASTVAKALGVSPKQVYAPASPASAVLVRDANLWSHKQGFATGPLLRDACGKAIKDPRAACRSYGRGELNYTQFCGAVCIKSRKSRRAGGPNTSNKRR